MEKFQTFQVDQIRWSPRHGPGKGPWRICKFCLLGVLLPLIFLFIPLYMRFRALRPTSLHLSPSDMKLLNHESKVSTSWCEAQNLHMNSTFHAYLLPHKPRLRRNRHRVNMERDMVLEDDVKEYWGFYLLAGSYFKVRACSRHEGASLVVIKSGAGAGQCTWLGELDSLEESDEEDEESQEFQFENGENEDQEYQFGDGENEDQDYHFEDGENEDLDYHFEDGENEEQDYQLVDSENDDQYLKVFPNQSSDKRTSAFQSNESEEAVSVNEEEVMKDQPRSDRIEGTLGTDSKEVKKYLQNIGKWSPKSQNILIQQLLGLQARQLVKKETTKNTQSRKSYRTKSNKKQMKKSREFKKQKENKVEITRLKHRSLKIQNEKKRAETLKKIKELELRNANLEEEYENMGAEVFDDENNKDSDIESFLQSGKLNQTDPQDNSNEEVRSSWSSSEEALVACEGVIAIAPLDGATKCHKNASEQDLESSMVEITHMVEKTGFYYFIFSNENEITDNFIRSRFVMLKTVFDVSHATNKCVNSSTCSLPLTFWSEEHVVLEVPQTANSSCEYNAEGLTSYHQCYNIVRAESICQPRGRLYVIFLLLVPILILMFSYI